MDNLTEIKSCVGSGESGPWRVEKFTVDEHGADVHNMRCFNRPGMAARLIEPGNYTRLVREAWPDPIMSDVPVEIRDHLEFVRRARGTVLVNGLGLGLVLQMLMTKPDIENVTVVEESYDVICLVAGYFESHMDKFGIVHGDAMEYDPPEGIRYDAVWHDIWDMISSDNLPEMEELHRKYEQVADWQGSWCKSLCERYA